MRKLTQAEVVLVAGGHKLYHENDGSQVIEDETRGNFYQGVVGKRNAGTSLPDPFFQNNPVQGNRVSRIVVRPWTQERSSHTR